MGRSLLRGAILSALVAGWAPSVSFPETVGNDYAAVLERFVDEHGRVDYRTLKTGREPLDRYVDTLAGTPGSDYGSWSENEKIAFWINAYNALTLRTIIDHYPIRKGGLLGGGKPGGIRDISGAWNGIKHDVLGEAMTLDHIEHGILRKQFLEPRVHFALVCASIGCPVLRREPYDGKRLDAQLEDQAGRFLLDPAKFKIDPDRRRVFLSPIFKWFGGDFETEYGPSSPYKAYSKKNSAVLNFIAGYLGDDDRRVLSDGKFDVEYLDYDWSLNDKSAR